MDLEASRKANGTVSRLMRVAAWICFAAAGGLLIVSLTAPAPTKSGVNLGQTPQNLVSLALADGT